MPFFDVLMDVRRTHYVRVSASSSEAAVQAAEQQVCVSGADTLISEVRSARSCSRLLAECCGTRFESPMGVVIHMADEHDAGLLRAVEGQQ